jgi:hypothetical protein
MTPQNSPLSPQAPLVPPRRASSLQTPKRKQSFGQCGNRSPPTPPPELRITPAPAPPPTPPKDNFLDVDDSALFELYTYKPLKSVIPKSPRAIETRQIFSEIDKVLEALGSQERKKKVSFELL